MTMGRCTQNVINPACIVIIYRSGSASNLEIALALSRLGIEPKNKV